MSQAWKIFYIWSLSNKIIILPGTVNISSKYTIKQQSQHQWQPLLNRAGWDTAASVTSNKQKTENEFFIPTLPTSLLKATLGFSTYPKSKSKAKELCLLHSKQWVLEINAVSSSSCCHLTRPAAQPSSRALLQTDPSWLLLSTELLPRLCAGPTDYTAVMDKESMNPSHCSHRGEASGRKTPPRAWLGGSSSSSSLPLCQITWNMKQWGLLGL